MIKRPLTLLAAAAGLVLSLASAAHAEAPPALAAAPTADAIATTLDAGANNDLSAENIWSVRHHLVEAQRFALDQQLGQATLHMEQARYLQPFSIELRQGLDLLRQEVQQARMARFIQGRMTQGEPAELWWWRLFHTLPSRVWAWAALVLLWSACGLWMLRRKMRTSVQRDMVSVMAVGSALLFGITLACWAGAVRTSSALEPGVIVAQNPRYYAAPDELAVSAISPDLYEGAVVVVRGHQQEWAEVELANRARVWIHRDAVSRIEVCP